MKERTGYQIRSPERQVAVFMLLERFFQFSPARALCSNPAIRIGIVACAVIARELAGVFTCRTPIACRPLARRVTGRIAGARAVARLGCVAGMGAVQREITDHSRNACGRGIIARLPLILTGAVPACRFGIAGHRSVACPPAVAGIRPEAGQIGVAGR